MRIQIPYNYEPREYQETGLARLDEGITRFFLLWHRRAGKDVTWFNALIREACRTKGIYYYVLPTYKQARKIIWDGMSDTGWQYLDYIPKCIRRDNPNQTEMKVRLKNGSLIQLIGSDNYDRMVGTNPRGIVYSEWALQEEMAWRLMAPILAENGGWAAFITTPRGHNHAWEMSQKVKSMPTWFYEERSILQTKRPDGSPVISESQVKQELAEGTMDEALAKQEYYVSWEGPNQGSYWGKWMENLELDGNIENVPHDPRLPVYTFWDLGIDDSMCIWFMQYSNREFRFINYYENDGYGLDHYVQYMNQQPYTYARHFFPHDVAVREIGNKGKTRKTALEELGVRNINVGLALSIIDGINAVRLVLPLCRFDKTKCAKGIKWLKEYSRERDEKHKIWKNTPAHGPASHAASAFREFANSFEEVKKIQPRQTVVVEGRHGWMR